MRAPVRIGLVGCSSLKASNPAPARRLYVSPLFRGSLAAAEAACGEHVFVLSALHGLVLLDDAVAPYQLHLSRLSPVQRLKWGERVLAELAWRYPVEEAQLHVWAGEAYVASLRTQLPEGWTLHTPLAGLQVGERLAVLAAVRRPAPVQLELGEVAA